MFYERELLVTFLEKKITKHRMDNYTNEEYKTKGAIVLAMLKAKEKISDNIIELCYKIENCNTDIRKSILSKMSGFELAYAMYLDNQGVKWLYEYKTFDLGSTTYNPDFYLPESDTYVEIKGYWHNNSKKKYYKFRRKFGNIILLNEQRLKQLGVIK
jgi:predicted nuclease of restriction endonuclease-like RecB superfamily